MQGFNKLFIKQCTQGNRNAQKLLFEQTFASMLRICLRYVGHTEDAEDCTMKGFVKTFQHLDTFKYEGEDSFQKWLRRIMVNECLMHLRKRKNLVLYTDEPALDIALPAEVLIKMDAAELNRLVMQLPTGYRTVFNLFAVDGYSHKEIAAILQITENTSKSQFSKAKARLKLLIEQDQQHEYGQLGK